MTFAVPCEEYKVNPILARAMDRIFILHADHEQNASTATVRNAGSSGANPFACIAAGIASLWGPAHGGANEAVLKMLDRIGDKSHIRNSSTTSSPRKTTSCCSALATASTRTTTRARTVLRDSLHEVLAELGIKDDPLLELAKELEKIALSDDYFIKRRAVSRTSISIPGIILKAMGFPMSMFTVLFAIARTVGWVAQWTEMIEDPDAKLMRPRQLFTGSDLRHYQAIAERG